MKMRSTLPASVGTLYGRQIDRARRVWTSGGWATQSDSTFASSVKTTLTDPEGSGNWQADCPAGAVALASEYEIRLQAGGSPAADDVVVDGGEYQDYHHQQIGQMLHVGINTWYVNPSGSDSNDGRTMASAFKSLWKGLSVATAGDIVRFTGTIDQTSANTDLYDAGSGGVLLDHRQLRVPGGVSLIGSGMESAWIITDSDANAVDGTALTADGNDAYMEGFTIHQIQGPTLNQFTTPIGYNGNPTTGVVVRRVRAIADTDVGYHRCESGSAYWKYYDCVFDSNYDAHVIFGNGDDQQVDYYNCDFIVRGPSVINSVKNNARGISPNNGITRCYGCRVWITTTNEAVTDTIIAVYARQLAGHPCRIELHDCSLMTKVSSSYVATNLHIKADANTTVIISSSSYNLSRVSFDPAATVVYLSPPINQANQIGANAIVDLQTNRAAKIDDILNAAALRNAVGMAAANLDSQLNSISLVASSAVAAATAAATSAGQAASLSGLIQVVTDKYATMIEDAGGGLYRYTVPSLANAPTGSGGGGNTYETDENSYDVEEEPS